MEDNRRYIDVTELGQEDIRELEKLVRGIENECDYVYMKESTYNHRMDKEYASGAVIGIGSTVLGMAASFIVMYAYPHIKRGIMQLFNK